MPALLASADANVSFDAKAVLFAGKKSAGDPWQIWELTLADHAVRQVIGGCRRMRFALCICRAGDWSTRSELRRDFNCNRAIADSEAWADIEPSGKSATLPLTICRKRDSR